MPKESLQPEGLAVPRLPYSPVVVSGEIVVTAGQVAHDETGAIVAGAIREQTRQVLGNIERCLGAAGCTKADVIKVNVFLTDFADFEGFNEEYAAFFERPYPVRTTVQVGLPPGILIEIEATARR
jgi:2-iminobutanoate/2-iminopropanoate deaminase